MKGIAIGSVNALNEILSQRQEAYRKAFSLTLASPVQEVIHEHFRKSLNLKKELNELRIETDKEVVSEVSFSKEIWIDLGHAIENGGINKEQNLLESFVNAEEGTLEEIRNIMGEYPDLDQTSENLLKKIEKLISADLKEIKSLWMSN